MRLQLGDVWIEVTQGIADDLRLQLDSQITGPPVIFDKPLSKNEGAVDTATAAELIGMSKEYVRAHAVQLGGIKRGNAWRFDPAKLVPENVDDSSTVSVEAQTPKRRRRRRKAPGAGLLQIRGEAP